MNVAAILARFREIHREDPAGEAEGYHDRIAYWLDQLLTSSANKPATSSAVEPGSANEPATSSAVEPAARFAQRPTSSAAEPTASKASLALTLASGCLHLRRWAIPRADYPAGRAGYKRWRRDLAAHHAKEAAAILKANGADPELIARVGDLVKKSAPKLDPEAQALEDAACLVFLERDLARFAHGRDDAKVIAILRKTWRKMSPAAHQTATTLAAELPPKARELVARALAAPERDV